MIGSDNPIDGSERYMLQTSVARKHKNLMQARELVNAVIGDGKGPIGGAE